MVILGFEKPKTKLTNVSGLSSIDKESLKFLNQGVSYPKWNLERLTGW